ncbi:MAG TPA: hypothetical protein VKR38_07270 [Usitatibacter sp.]|nr:hypothetical protein [Usitatibacter sp.]
MKPRKRHSTALWFVALACLVFGFVPLLVVMVTAGMEFAWLLAMEPQPLGWTASGVGQLAEQAFHDWAALYVTDGQYDLRLFAAQAVCAVLWCAYVLRMRRIIC